MFSRLSRAAGLGIKQISSILSRPQPQLLNRTRNFALLPLIGGSALGLSFYFNLLAAEGKSEQVEVEQANGKIYLFYTNI